MCLLFGLWTVGQLSGTAFICRTSFDYACLFFCEAYQHESTLHVIRELLHPGAVKLRAISEAGSKCAVIIGRPYRLSASSLGHN